MYLSVYWLARHMVGQPTRGSISEARNNIIEFINQPLPLNINESVEKNIEGIEKRL